MESSGSQSCPSTCLAFSRTRKGLVLIGEIILCLLTLICFGASRSGYAGLAAVELVFAALVLLAWGCRLPPRLPLLHWGWTDFTRCVIGAVLFLITSLIVIVGHRDGAGIAGGVFGILAGILLGYDAYITLPTRQGTPPPPLSPQTVPEQPNNPETSPDLPPRRGTPSLKLLRGPDAWVPPGVGGGQG